MEHPSVTWNFNFHSNLTDTEIDELSMLLSSSIPVYLSTSFPDERNWLSNSTGDVFNLFFSLSSLLTRSSHFFPLAKFIKNAKAPPNFNINGMLQLRRLGKAFCPDQFVMCLDCNESMYRLILHYSIYLCNSIQ